jgi:hypothetical protein
MMGVGEELVTIPDSQQKWTVELLVVGAVAALYAAVVSLATLGIASELSV